jgi:hypothetical protein
MLNPNGEAIYSAGLTEFADLVYDIVVTKAPKGRNVSKYWEEVYKVLPILDALEDVDVLEEENANALYSCLVEILNIFDTSDYPTPTSLPAVIIGTGPVGEQGIPGEKGDTGGGKSFNGGTISSTTIVDSIGVSSAYAARWDYIVNATAQRAGTIIATWTEDGASIEWDDDSTLDIGGSTSGIAFTVTYSAGFINLVANITSGIWAVSGTRYLIPESGTYIPVGSSLTQGNIFIGDTANMAVGRSMSGDAAIDYLGVLTISNDVIDNNNINSSANIALSKLASLNNSIVPVTGISGKLESSNITATELGTLSGIDSNIQDQLDDKQDLITGAASTIVSSDLGANLVMITNGAGKADDSTISVTKLNYLSGVTSDIQTQLNSKVSIGTGALVTVSFQIGDWNMDTTGGIVVTCAGIDYTKVRNVTGIIRNDADTNRAVFCNYNQNTTAGIDPSLGIGGIIDSGSDIQVIVRRVDSSDFDNTSYDSTGYNRGWLLVTYEA